MKELNEKTVVEDITKHEKFRNDYLKLKNPFPDEDCIIFEEEGHNYRCFNKYFNKWFCKSEYDDCIGMDLESSTGIIDTMFFDKFKDIARMLFLKNKKAIETDPTHKYFGCKSPEDIQATWSSAAVDGTKMHEVYEIYCNLYQQSTDTKDLTIANEYFNYLGEYREKKFLKHLVDGFKISKGHLEFYRTEAKMYDPVLNMSGTIDLLLIDPSDKQIVIVDHKRSKNALKPDTKHRVHNPKNYGLYLDSWKKIQNTSFNHYNLQLQLYRYILEMNYGFKVKAMALAVLDPTKKGMANEYTIKPLQMEGHFRTAILDYIKERAKCILQTENLPAEYVKALKDRIEYSTRYA